MRVHGGAFFLMLPSWWERERKKSGRREEGVHIFSEMCVCVCVYVCGQGDVGKMGY